MEKDEAALRLARQVSTSLVELRERGRPCPGHADRFDWSADLLDELARAVSMIGEVIDHVAGPPGAPDPTDPHARGEHDPPDDDDPARAVDRHSRALATAIVCQRNSLLRRL